MPIRSSRRPCYPLPAVPGPSWPGTRSCSAATLLQLNLRQPPLLSRPITHCVASLSSQHVAHSPLITASPPSHPSSPHKQDVVQTVDDFVSDPQTQKVGRLARRAVPAPCPAGRRPWAVGWESPRCRPRCAALLRQQTFACCLPNCPHQLRLGASLAGRERVPAGSHVQGPAGRLPPDVRPGECSMAHGPPRPWLRAWPVHDGRHGTRPSKPPVVQHRCCC